MDRQRPEQLAEDIFRYALRRVHAGRVVQQSLALEGRQLVVHVPAVSPVAFSLSSYRRITVIGAGKATAAMAQGLEELLGSRIDDGLIVVKDNHALPLQRVQTVEASHPIPDERGLDATRRLMQRLQACGEDDLVIALISGGGSALLPAPVAGITLQQKQAVTSLLMRAGATIHQLNVVRQHLSASKGGQLAALAYPATVIVLIVSDVIGDDPAFIASGPFTPCRTSSAQLRQIISELDITARLPESVREHLCKGTASPLPGPDHPAFQRVHTFVLANNRLVLQAAEERSRELGFTPMVLASSLQGEARTVAGVLAAIAREARGSGHPGAPPLCLLAGGETTVTVRGQGKGGRNLEMALAAALALDGWQDIVFLSGGTDGTDGDTDAAGAWSDGTTVAAARGSGLESRHFLQENDSYTFFQKVGGLITTGPTWTNVMDLQVVLIP